MSLTIKDSLELDFIVENTKLTKATVISSLVDLMHEMGLIEDDFESFGKTVEMLTDDYRSISIEAWGKTSHGITREMKGLTFINMTGDCEVCGCQTETYSEMDMGFDYTVRRCENRVNCGNYTRYKS